jgi:hypothetical protein
VIEEDRIRAAYLATAEKAAKEAAAETVGKRAISLTVAVVRAKALRECLGPVLQRLGNELRDPAL